VKTLTDKALEFAEELENASPFDMKIARTMLRQLGKDSATKGTKRRVYLALAAAIYQVGE
jgi:hypothetical protein